MEKCRGDKMYKLCKTEQSARRQLEAGPSTPGSPTLLQT